MVSVIGPSWSVSCSGTLPLKNCTYISCCLLQSPRLGWICVLRGIKCQVGSHRHYLRFLITVLHRNPVLRRAGTGTKRLVWDLKEKFCSCMSQCFSTNHSSAALLILPASPLPVGTSRVWWKLWRFASVSHFPHLLSDSWATCHGRPKTLSLTL